MPHLYTSPLPQLTDVAAARQCVRDWLGPTASRDVVDAVLIVTSELVTNAVRHARTGFALAVDIAPGGSVRIEVFDEDSRMPERVPADDESTSGRGLELVSALTTAWGASVARRRGITGKVVWAEIGPPSRPRSREPEIPTLEGDDASGHERHGDQ